MTEVVLAVNPQEFGIEQSKANDLIGNLPTIKAEREILAQQYPDVLKLDIEDPKTAKVAKELRLRIRDNRTKGIEVWHKTTKEVFLCATQFIDAVKRKECEENLAMEAKLQEIEKYAENKEKERLAALEVERKAIIEPYAEFVPPINLSTLSDEDFKKIITGAKLQFDAKVERERKEQEERERLEQIKRLDAKRRNEALPYFHYWTEFEKSLNFGEQSETDFNAFITRIKKEKADADAEAERLRLENERIAKQQEAERQAAEAERKRLQEEAEKQAKIAAQEASEKQRLIQEKLKREQEAKAAEEAKLKAEAEAAEKARKEAEKLAKAPIKKQMNVWIETFEIPATNIDNEQVSEIKAKFEAFKNWAKGVADAM